MRDVAPASVRESLDSSVAVTLLGPLEGVGGGHWNRGEVAGFPPALACDLIARGIAEPFPKPKAPERPGADKMVKTAPVKK